jgi:predicted dinucleotide-binding enzyme
VLVAQLPGAGVVLVIQSVALHPDAKQTATQLLSDTGFDSVDPDSLSQGRQFHRGTAPYVQRYIADELTDALN